MHMMWFGCIMVLSGSFNSFIPYPYHTPGGTKNLFYCTVYDSLLGCYLLYLAVYLHWSLGHRFGEFVIYISSI